MKQFICLLLAFFSYSITQAQTVKLGFKGGLNYSNLSGDLMKSNDQNSKTAFHGGISANVGLGYFLSFQPEVILSQKGYQYMENEVRTGNSVYERKGKVNYTYIDVPLLLRLKAKGLFAELGPQLSYLTGIQDRTEVSINNIEQKEVQRISKGDMEPWELGFATGLGYQTEKGISIGLRYNGKIKNFARENANNSLTNARFAVLQLQAGILLSSFSQL
ncbi:porin family protein [Adhaeribacter aquaticus]|uniref:porin family protein n=1 Tax=Adhaeribacter aquaticus TaxID=299567 RepID=UPI00041F0F4D|nr:porin family protein [Adhaeribacter aquaticus]